MPPLNITGVDGATMTMTATRDTSTNAPSILTFNVIFCGITLLVVGARFYVKTAMLKTAGTDDFLMAAATICGFGVFICMIGETKHGIGMHTASILPDEYMKMIHWRFFHSIIVTLAIALVKLSVAVFLLRLVPGRKYKFFLYGMIVFLLAFTLSSLGTILFSCVPIRASWDPTKSNSKCFSLGAFKAIGMFNSVVNIVTDVLFATLPIPMV